MRQIALPLSSASDSPPRIVVGTGNAGVVDALLEPGTWPFHTAILSGPPRSGKSLLARWFATKGRPLATQFDAGATRRGANGCLLLATALAALEQRTEQVLPAGDHDVLLGAVTAIHGPVVDPATDTAGTAHPTVYFASRYWGLA